MDRLNNSPCRWRSSGTSAMPARAAARGSAGSAAAPCTATRPAEARWTPKSVSSNSERPNPTRPNIPTISPGATSSVTSWK